MSAVQVDPTAMNNVYRERLAAANDENVLLTAACTQLQQRVEQLETEVKLQQGELDTLTTSHPVGESKLEAVVKKR